MLNRVVHTQRGIEMLRALVIVAVLFPVARPLCAQIAPPNDAGVSAGHEHFRATDVTAAERFWTALGGVTTPLGQTRVLRFPGVIVMLARATSENPVKGGSEGSTVDAIGFRVKSLTSTLRSLATAGYSPLPISNSATIYVLAPDGVKVQLVDDQSLPTAVAADVLIMRVPNVAEAADWYGKWFGAGVVQRGGATYAEIPGMNIRFEPATQPVSGTQGRAIDHIGFEVRNLEAFTRRLAAGGVTIVRPYGPVPDIVKPTLKSLAFVTDPWGTYIELNEGFAEVR